MAIIDGEAKRIIEITEKAELTDNDFFEGDNGITGGFSANLLSLAKYLGNGLLVKVDDFNNIKSQLDSLRKQRIGVWFSFGGDKIPENSLWLNGDKLNISDYKDLFNIGGFVDNGDGTFNLPDTRDRYIRGASATRKVLGTEEDAIQNIKGSFSGYDWVKGKGGGAFKRDTTSPQTYNFANDNADNGTLVKLGGFSFDASRVVRTADETRVKGIFTKICVWYQ